MVIIMTDTIYSLFEDIVTTHRDETAIIKNSRTMTFSELSKLVDNIAGSFSEEVACVGIVMGHRVEMVAAQNPELPAYVLYTSGTTGRPKGVCVTNCNVCHYVRAFENEFHPTVGDVMLQYSVCSFDIFVEEVFSSLLNGAAIAIPFTEDKADVRAFTDEDGLSYMTAYVVPADRNLKVSAVKKELAENLTPFMLPEFIVKMPKIPRIQMESRMWRNCRL